MSAAPAAIARDRESSRVRGDAKTRRVSPIVFIARADAPMLPGCVVSFKTIRTRPKTDANGQVIPPPPPFFRKPRRPGRAEF